MSLPELSPLPADVTRAAHAEKVPLGLVPLVWLETISGKQSLNKSLHSVKRHKFSCGGKDRKRSVKVLQLRVYGSPDSIPVTNHFLVKGAARNEISVHLALFFKN